MDLSKIIINGSHIHFIGIGGVSMSGLAEILHKAGCTITGSDLNRTSLTQKLEDMGVKIYYKHASENIKGYELVVYTAAISQDNPELLEARDQGIPAIERAILLGEIMKRYKHSIAISGTHGKTTTTSMLSMIFLMANTDPTISVGGVLDIIGGTIRAGGNDYFIAEACEYVESFLKFHPYCAAVLNIDADHLDYFKNLEHIISSFNKFINQISSFVLVNGEDDNCIEAIQGISCEVLTFGCEKTCDFRAENIEYDSNGYPFYDLYFKNKKIAGIQLNVPGLHNVFNSLAAAGLAYKLCIPTEFIVDGLMNFFGAKRRFDKKAEINGVLIIDDYAHHPTEIKATLTAAQKIKKNKILCIFQPHTYTRTYALLDEFAEGLRLADKVIVTDIYAAREKDTGLVSSKDLANILDNSVYISKFQDIASYVLEHIRPGDVVITMGAGNVNVIGELILESYISKKSVSTKFENLENIESQSLPINKLNSKVKMKYLKLS